MISDDDMPEDLADQIVSVESYEAAIPAKKEFLPWHRPRKQFVRDRQWCNQISALLDEITLDGGTIKYFGLPGVDLLDLRCFHEAICVPRQLKLRFLGFNSASHPKSSQQSELNISLDEVTKLGFIDPLSIIVPDDIRRLTNEDSIAWQRTLDLGPYDIVNLDLCDGFGADAVDEVQDNYYNATTRLLAIQARQKTPWLLLLTTRVGGGHVHADTLSRLIERYGKNLIECAQFQEESLKEFDIGDAAALDQAVGTSMGLQSVFLVGVCKWLLGLAMSHSPPSTVEVKSVLGYRVDKGSEIIDLVSLAIRFNPTFIPVEDPAKLASAIPEKPDECAQSVQALKRVAKLADVDAILAADAGTQAQMVATMCGLLESARYDVDAYSAWVVAQE